MKNKLDEYVSSLIAEVENLKQALEIERAASNILRNRVKDLKAERDELKQSSPARFVGDKTLAINFGTWYSGMERDKVVRAYERFLREEKPDVIFNEIEAVRSDQGGMEKALSLIRGLVDIMPGKPLENMDACQWENLMDDAYTFLDEHELTPNHLRTAGDGEKG